jgi:two-component system CheB/CheR fusion protein
LVIADDHIGVIEFDEPRWQRAPIDILFRSRASQHGDDFAIVLSGAGSDGSIGIKAVKEAGGIILVQDPEEAEYGSMPRSAIATGLADFVLPVREIAGRLPELIRAHADLPSDAPGEVDEEALQKILSRLRVVTGHDFSAYKPATIRRRIARRMQVQRAATMADYLAVLRESGAEARALFRDLLISVTMFFRDPAAFARLAELVMPTLFEGKGAGEAIGSGSLVARPARKPIRSPSSCSRKPPGGRCSAISRCSPRISTKRRSRSAAKADIRTP